MRPFHLEPNPPQEIEREIQNVIKAPIALSDGVGRLWRAQQNVVVTTNTDTATWRTRNVSDSPSADSLLVAESMAKSCNATTNTRGVHNNGYVDDERADSKHPAGDSDKHVNSIALEAVHPNHIDKHYDGKGICGVCIHCVPNSNAFFFHDHSLES